MNEHDQELQKALTESSDFRTQTMREASATEFSNRVRWAERIYWIYAVILVLIGVLVINYFARTRDTKELIICAVVILVVYETTVLMKLWFAVAATKLSILKDMKLLRFEVARLAAVVGVEHPAEPSIKYEPVRGSSPWERKLWLGVCVVAAIAASTWSSNLTNTGGGKLSADSVITVQTNGNVTTVTNIAQTYSKMQRPQTITMHVPKDCEVRWVDNQDETMPVTITPTGTHHRYDVEITNGAIVDDMLKYTQVTQFPLAATEQDGTWTFNSDRLYSASQNELKVTVLLPLNANVDSVKPTPSLQYNQSGSTILQFNASRAKDEKFQFSIQYRLDGKQNL
ncbi:hypothetical protein CA13_43080 [Planctomycetes bacterium CA13]|uniref:Uncharacterized protein n=1 Tax=Novipirellula herctigrandis TaxID=2527986 RepID=A0A5C5Z6J8_9BACT|nr:hypothetical protein CA13_43080 [Planctomycetes bacterium CA13]